jgi:hypothetical protein
VLITSVPGTQYGQMRKISGASDVPWGTTTGGDHFAPGGTNNRIFAGQGFRYVNGGTGLGQSESIPVRFSDGFTNVTDTLQINIVAPAGAPQITTQPVGLTSVGTGGSATLSVVATGNAPLAYQWFTGLSPNTQFPISGATSATYTTPPLANTGNDYYYWVRVSNAVTSVASLTSTVKVGAVPTANAGGPYNVVEGGTVQLTGSGTDPNNGLFLAYEWDLNGNGIFAEPSGSNGAENVRNPVFMAQSVNGPTAHIVTLRTTNDRGLSATSSATVNISNVPVLMSSSFDAITRQAVVLGFDSDASVQINRNSIQVVNDTRSTPINVGSLAWNLAGTQATLDLTHQLPDGNYRAILGTSTLSFHVLAGDFNRDKSVNFSDLLILAQNYGQAGRTNSQGDANYDGNVNFSDLLLLAQRYGQSLASISTQPTGGIKSTRRRGLAEVV